MAPHNGAMFRSLGLCLLLLASVSATAAEWIKVRSANLEMYTDASERDARSTLATFEQVREFFMRVKSSQVTTRLPVTIVGFRNLKEYQPYASSEISVAYYVGDEQRDYIVMSGLGSEQTPVAIHEYMHLLVRHSGMKMPAWLNEGFAEVYSTLRPMGGQILLGALPQGRTVTLQTEKWIPFERLFAIDHDSAEFHDKKRGAVLYAEAWLLTHMLALSEQYRDKFGAFAAAASASSSEKALQDVYGLSLSRAEKELKAYSTGRSMQGILYKTKFEKIQVEDAEPAKELDVSLTLAKLTALLGRYDDAIGRYKQLSGNGKDRYEAEEGLGYLYWRKGDAAAARQHLQRATELGDSSWKTWWDYARLALSAGERAPQVQSALRKTLELKPDLTDARLMLGSELYRDRSWAQAYTQLREVKVIDPERAPWLFLTMAHCAMNLDQKDDARKWAAEALKHSTKDADRDSAQRLMEYLDRPPLPVSASALRPESVARRDVRPIEDAGAPQLQRREAPETTFTEIRKEEPHYLTVRGRLKRFDCLGAVARMQVVVNGSAMLLLLRRPNEITILSGGGKPVDMNCGVQDQPVSVDYIPNPDAKHQTSGDVHAVEFLAR